VLGGLATSGSTPWRVDAASERGVSASPPRPRWFEQAWRRAVIDMHIPDWDEKFLSEFDADRTVEALVQSRAQSIVCYAQSHVGLFNYPTKVGRQHAGLKGRDIVAEMIERCHRRDIAVVLYVSVIHDRWAADQHPDWRIIHPNGGHFGQGSRHGFVCPNSPYRDYVRAWAQELAERFDLDGVRFDMTFWVCVCYCPHCQRRWRDEVGGDLPRTVDWTDERWVRFQRQREQWLGEFAEICTNTVKTIRPQASVEHQSSIYPGSWNNGASWPLVARNDFLQGDFYGDALQGSFVRKLLEDMTPSRPFGYETSFSVSLQDHTARKSEALLEAKASAAIADAAAFIFIDAIDPIGTVNPHAHERMGRVFDRLLPYYRELGGERVADVGLFYSLDSRFDMRSNGQSVLQVDNGADTHTRSTMQAARALIAQHLPWRMVTRKSIGHLSHLKTLVLSNVHHLAEEELSAIRTWVNAGGTLYASGATSLVKNTGQRQPDFMLGDVLGVSLVKADWTDREHYIAPTDAGRRSSPAGIQSIRRLCAAPRWTCGHCPARPFSPLALFPGPLPTRAVSPASTATRLGWRPTRRRSWFTGSGRAGPSTPPRSSRRSKRCRKALCSCCGGSTIGSPSKSPRILPSRSPCFISPTATATCSAWSAFSTTCRTCRWTASRCVYVCHTAFARFGICPRAVPTGFAPPKTWWRSPRPGCGPWP
jgi:hypothetical protein